MPYKDLSDLQKQNIIDSYIKLETAQSIGERYNMSASAIIYHLRKAGIKTRTFSDYRTHNMDQNFFETIDTEAKAYFLGLMYADGNIMPDGRRISIGLIESDIHLLESLKIALNTTYPIGIYKPNDIGVNNLARIDMYSGKMCDDLAKKGCIKNKTLSLTFPSNDIVPSVFMRHFIRGLFDGDGCIQKSGKRISFSVCGTYQLCLGLKQFLIDKFAIFDSQITGKGNVFYFRTIGFQAMRVFDWIYHDCNLKMTRKYIKYIEYIKYIADERVQPYVWLLDLEKKDYFDSVKKIEYYYYLNKDDNEEKTHEFLS